MHCTGKSESQSQSQRTTKKRKNNNKNNARFVGNAVCHSCSAHRFVYTLDFAVLSSRVLSLFKRGGWLYAEECCVGHSCGRSHSYSAATNVALTVSQCARLATCDSQHVEHLQLAIRYCLKDDIDLVRLQIIIMYKVIW